MTDHMSRFGVGPRFFLISILYAGFTIALHRYHPDTFSIHFIPYNILNVLGAFLLTIGIPFYIVAVVTGMKAYNQSILCTKGIYGLCRHPIYASWVVFLIPGIMFLMNSLIGLTTVPVMYISLRILVQKEDAYLERKFEDQFRKYKKSIPAVLPIGFCQK